MNIYVGNLPYETGDTELKEAFDQFGQIDEARVIQDRYTGRSRGFGFVEMSSDTEAQAAIEAMNGTELAGRTLTVNEAKPREDRGSRDGGGGGGGHSRY